MHESRQIKKKPPLLLLLLLLLIKLFSGNKFSPGYYFILVGPGPQQQFCS
jgi:hypothetical protein